MAVSPFLPVVSGVVLVAGLVFAVLGARELGRGRALRRDGEVVEAEVVDVEFLRPRTTAEPTSGRFHPVVRFRTRAGVTVQATTVVGATPAPARPGDRVQVRYDPARPERVELAQGLASTSTLGCMFLALGGAVAAIAGVFLVVSLVLYQAFP